MKFIFITVVIILNNSILFINGHGIQNKVNTIQYTKHVIGIYSDLVSGKFNRDSDVMKYLNTKTGNYNNDRCNEQLQIIIDQFSNDTSIRTSNVWASEMFDASSKIPEGILYGNRNNLGNFDQCLQIVHNTDDFGIIRGQYCLTPTMLYLDNFGDGTRSVVLMNGLCIPDSCEPTYLFLLLQYTLQGSNAAIVPMDPELLCSLDDPVELSAIDITAIIVFSIIVFLLIASTVYDVYTTQTNKPKREVFMAYSIITNGSRLFSVERAKSPDVMNCLNGIRVLSLVWVIFGHTYGTLTTSPINFAYVSQWISNGFSMLVAQSDVSVDTFFLLSGLLVTYNVFKELKKSNGKLNIPMMYVHRFLRLTPPYAMTLLLSLTFISHIGQGPFSKQAFTEMEPCHNWWWSTLLYVQNYVNPDEICMRHTWYLQLDMQLFLLAPLILIPLWKWGRNMLPVIYTILCLSLGCYFATSYINNTTVGLFAAGNLPFYATHLRMGTWLCGVLLAYAIIKTKGRELKFPMWLVYGAWFIAIVTILAVIFGPYHIHQLDYIETAFESALYHSLHRIAWCIALSWLIFACVRGFGGHIDLFLSHPVWLPLARMSYSMYLTSLPMQMYRRKIAKIPSYFSDYSAINTFWSDFGVTFTISIFWVLAFEMPVPILEKFIFSRKPKPKSKPLNIEQDLDNVEAKQ